MSAPPLAPDPDAPPAPSVEPSVEPSDATAERRAALEEALATDGGDGAGDDAAAAAARHAQDSALARVLRRLDRGLGTLEQGLLFALLLSIVGVAVATVTLHLSWADEFIRYGVFAMAMIGGAYATHHQRLLSMDVVSRTLRPRGRAVLRLVLALFTLAMTGVLFSGGLQILALQQQAHQTGAIPTWVPAAFIPLGMALVATHLLLQAVIELDYLRRGLCAPQPEQGAL